MTGPTPVLKVRRVQPPRSLNPGQRRGVGIGVRWPLPSVRDYAGHMPEALTIKVPLSVTWSSITGREGRNRWCFHRCLTGCNVVQRCGLGCDGGYG